MLGQANADSIYFDSWVEASDKLDHSNSHKYLGSTLVDFWLKKKVLQYRFGMLPTRKLLARFGKVSNSLCKLCGQEDGGHHALSACPALYRATILRHNDAVTEIVHAICKGSRGNEVLMSDVGIGKRLSPGELPEACHHRIPANYPLPEYMPPRAQTALRSHCSIPDVLLFERDHNSKSNEYTLVEVKYCRDTDPSQQRARALEQHKQLMVDLMHADPTSRVKLVTILLGVSGSIYKRSNAAMQYLGVRGSALQGLLKRLHFNAVYHIRKIWKHRAALMGIHTELQQANWSKWKRAAQKQSIHRKHTKRKR